MKSKQIVFTAPNVTELLETDLPEMGSHSVLVRTEFTAVSAGTERANLTGQFHISGQRSAFNTTFPRMFGYSGAGIVEEIGTEVSSVKPGDRVILYFGKHRSYNVMDEDSVFQIQEETVSSAEASMVVISCFSLAGVRKTKLEMGESAMVMGLGILGLMAVQVCRCGGAVPVIAVDPSPQRRALARKMGADIALDPREADFIARIQEITHGKGVNCAVEVTGVGAALNQALECMAQFGRVSLLGCTRDPVDGVDFYHLVHYPGVTLVGANNFARPLYESGVGNWTARDDAQTMLKLIAGGRIDLNSLISEIHSPMEAPEVYNRLVQDYGNFPIGVVFDWSRLK